MYPEDDHFHYTKDEIKEQFRENLYNGNWQISPAEYDQLCKLISCLDSVLVKILKEEIHTVIYSEQKDKDWDDQIVFACYLNLRDEMLLRSKIGVVFLSPNFLNLERGFITLKKLFHEIAHHRLDHRTDETVGAVAKKEEEADKLAYGWLCREIHHLEDC